MNIIGKAEVTAEQMAQYLINKNADSKPWALEYAKLYLEEGEAEGVRGDGAWIQSCKETGNFKFINTAVTFDQNNFCGLGVTSRGMKGHSFDTPRLGIRAQIQHLKGYATATPLVNECIDPRYNYISPKGKAPRFEDLGGKWAVPGYDVTKASSIEDAMAKGIGYGFDIVAGVENMKKIVVSNTTTSVKKYYRTICGAYSDKSKATNLATKVKAAGFNTTVKEIDGLFAVQSGAYSLKTSAENQLAQLKSKGFKNAIMYYDSVDKLTETVEEETNVAKKTYKIAVDAGHGSNTAGKRTPDGYREHWINVKTANYYNIALLRCGFETFKVGWDDTNSTDDEDTSLTKRQALVKAEECDASVSWHANAHGDGNTYTTGQGIETLVHNYDSRIADSMALAQAVHAELIKGTSQVNRGVKRMALSMCNCVKLGVNAAILIEIGFMTNEYEKELLKNDAFCLECAEEAARGTCNYFNVKYVEPSATAIKPSVSTNTSSTTNNITYEVKRGDTLSKIGKEKNIDWKKIAELNNIKSPYHLSIGQILQLPVTASSTTTTKPAEPVAVPVKITQSKKDIQKFLNEYYGDEIKKVLGSTLAVDGSIGNNSKKALAIAIQVELNKLGAGLAIDGSIGAKSAAAFDKYVGTLKKGLKNSIFVTLWQCIIVGHNLNPNGIDGSFGNGCVLATNVLFGKIGLAKDASVSGADLNALL